MPRPDLALPAASSATRDFHKGHLQIRQRVSEHGRFFLGQIAARLFLNHRELVDEHFRDLEIHFALAGLRVGDLPEEKRGVLRLHHDELDEALREFAGLGVGLNFGHIYSFEFADVSTGLTVAMTQGCC